MTSEASFSTMTVWRSFVQKDQIAGEIGGLNAKREFDFTDRGNRIFGTEDTVHMPSAELWSEDVDLPMVISGKHCDDLTQGGIIEE